MSLPEFSIRRPVTTMMIYIAVILFGVISYLRLSQELFPPISYPQLSIVTPYENAAPEEIETLITRPIEEAVGGISGLRRVSSISREGLSLVVVEFGWNQNMDFGSLAVREKIDLIKERLPRDSQEPIVMKFNPFELPVMTISVSSSERNAVQIKLLAKRWFKDEIEKIHGVASASISGGSDEQILVDVDQAKLRTAGLSINEVSDAITQSNLNYPGGTIKESFYEYLVRTLGEFKHIDEVGQITVKRENIRQGGNDRYNPTIEKNPSNRLILLRDVADIQRTEKERTSFSRFNSLENVTIAIQKQAQGNSLEIVKSIRKRLKELSEQLPKDVKVDVISDQSKFIQDALSDVMNSGLQGGFLAFFVLVIFLRDFKNSALVVTITPITVLATFTLMYFMNISLNVISLGGISLGVGMLLDNAVVVIENVYRKFRENPSEGMKKAAQLGSEEVMGPMVASTLTTVSVFLPLVFVTGIAGQIFKQLAWVVVVTQVISAVIAFTLLPMLIAKVGMKSALTKRDIHDEGSEVSAHGETAAKSMSPVEWALEKASIPIQAIDLAYKKLLPSFMLRKWFYLFIIFLLFLGSIFVFNDRDKILLPKIDQGEFMLKIDMPVGTRVIFTDKVACRVEKFLSSIEDVKNVSTVVGSSRGDSSKEILERLGSNQSQIIVTLKPKRKIPTSEVVQEVRKHFELSEGKQELGRARLSYVLFDSAFKVGSDTDAPIVIDIKGPELEGLKSLAEDVQDKLSKIPGVYGVSNSISEPFPETKLFINKDRSSFYRLSVTSVAAAANMAIKGFTASKFKEENKEIDIRVQLKESERDKLLKLQSLTVHSPLDMDIPLGDFVTFKTGKGPSEIRRESQERIVKVYAKIYERGLTEVTSDVSGVLDSMHIPQRYDVKIAGENEEVKESFASLQFAFVLSVILVYMIMAAQFESLWQPFLIMFCVPLSLIGVSFALFVSHTPLSVVVILGIILLGGIVVNNGIILIDYINQKRGEGIPLREAIILAGNTRLRPILMTAFSSAIGLAPLAFGIGEGNALQAPMAVTVMGGILLATFLTLIVTPSLYIGTEEIAALWKKPKVK